MNRIAALFKTDWAAMTATDRFGALFAIVVAVLMAAAWWYALSPKNREKFEADGRIPLNEDSADGRKGGRYG